MADYDIPNDLLFSSEDEWARVEDGRVVVGITDYAQQQLGDIVYVDLPEVGASFNQGDPFGAVESVKAVSDLNAPVSGEVVEINADLADRPEAVNADCYGDGWMIVFAPSEEGDTGALLDADRYRKHLEERSD